MVAGMYERLPVDAPPEAVVAALRDILRERGLTEYAVALRLAVIGRDGASEIVLRDMRTLIDADIADEFTNVLRGLAEAARERSS
jgi:hypothetical protein